MKNKRVVIALGGNALGENANEQKIALSKAAVSIVDLVEKGMEIVITHGNGPQVGMIQTAMDELITLIPSYGRVSLPYSVAMSQGYIGIDLENAIKNELAKRKLNKMVTTILTQVEVDKNDPAFKNPSKPIGRFMNEEEANELIKQGLDVVEDSGRGFRTVVASPKPQRILELNSINSLLDAGHVVIACGGGGIPVIKNDDTYEEVSAVIDKDNTSALLGKGLDADYLIILTAVEKVAINFGKENEQWLDELTVDQANEYIKTGEFGKGSMEPKVEASISFVSDGDGKEALITLLEKVSEALDGKTGTKIIG
uniref:carbamate kinase n=1 Tax=Anaerococcus mediterraneensis TaxID=1870984 RepID=UPI0009304C7B|nr:carbamate kinase [Anaerococcus mediterraneensis]